MQVALCSSLTFSMHNSIYQNECGCEYMPSYMCEHISLTIFNCFNTIYKYKEVSLHVAGCWQQDWNFGDFRWCQWNSGLENTILFLPVTSSLPIWPESRDHRGKQKVRIKSASHLATKKICAECIFLLFEK